MNRKTLVHAALIAGSCVAASYGINWLISPSQTVLVAEGRELFIHDWTSDDPLSGEGDGLGPVFNAKSCVACHFQSGIGGGGDNLHNVKTFQVLTNRNDSNHFAGVVHASATSTELLESQESLRSRYPVIPESTRVSGNCFFRVESFDPLIIESINTPSLFGAGVIDQISSYAIHSQERAVYWSSMTTATFENSKCRSPLTCPPLMNGRHRRCGELLIPRPTFTMVSPLLWKKPFSGPRGGCSICHAASQGSDQLRPRGHRRLPAIPPRATECGAMTTGSADDSQVVVSHLNAESTNS